MYQEREGALLDDGHVYPLITNKHTHIKDTYVPQRQLSLQSAFTAFCNDGVDLSRQCSELLAASEGCCCLRDVDGTGDHGTVCVRACVRVRVCVCVCLKVAAASETLMGPVITVQCV